MCLQGIDLLLSIEINDVIPQYLLIDISILLLAAVCIG